MNKINIIIFLLTLLIYYSYSDGNLCNSRWHIKLLINDDESNKNLSRFFRIYISQQLHRNIQFEEVDSSQFIKEDPNTKEKKLNLTSVDQATTELFDDHHFFGHLGPYPFYSDFDEIRYGWGYPFFVKQIAIYLKAKYIYRSNYNDILNNNFIIAEDDEETPISKCNEEGIKQFQKECKLNKMQLQCQNMTWIREKCMPIDDRHARDFTLVSSNVADFPTLYAFIAKFPNNSIDLCGPSANVIICESNQRFGNNYWFEVKYVNNCEDVETDPETIAVVAPSPYKVPADTHTTTVFTEQYALTDDEDLFVNSFPAVPPEKAILAINKFMKMNKCKRVAIISDDTDKSREYEQQFKEFFEKQNIIYVSISCDVSNCDFIELLKRIVVAEPKLILMNVAEEYAELFTEQIRKVKLQHKTWLFPRWSEAATARVAQHITDVFTITMSVTSYGYSYTDAVSNIMTTMSFVFHPRNVNELKKYPKKEHRRMSEKFKQYLNSTPIVAHVVQYSGQKHAVARITITADGTVENYLRLKDVYIQTGVNNCMFISKNYMKVCDDEDIMYIWLVVSVFALMVVLIVYFFQSSEVTYSRM